jgi:hypothetical protein
VDTSCRVAGGHTEISTASERESRGLPVSFHEPRVYPNPTADHLDVEFDITEKNKYEITLTDVPGKIVYTKTMMAVEGKNLVTLDLKEINSGLYVITLKLSGAIYQRKIVIDK